jgi:hypothetical protein
MTALAADRDTQERLSSFGQRVGDFGGGAIVDSTTLYKGALVALDQNDSKVKEGETSTTLIAMGVCRKQVTTGVSNTESAPEVDSGIFKFANSAAADEITAADSGNVCYIVDDQTVAKTDGTSTRSAAGRIYSVDADGEVWVSVNPLEA